MPEDQAFKLKDLTVEEQMVFNAIHDSGSDGALASQFKLVVNQSQAKVNAILKKLERQGLVKQVNSVSKNNRKVWLLSELEPSMAVTGGLSGTSSFDLERIQVVFDRVEVYAKKNGRVSHKELMVYIKQVGILPSDQLRDEDINQII